MNGGKEGGDFGERPLQLEGPFDPGVSQIGDADEVEGRHAGREDWELSGTGRSATAAAL